MHKFVFSTWPLVEATCPLKPTAFFILLKLFIIVIIIILYLFVKLQIYHKITFSSDNLRCFFPVVNQLIVTRSKKNPAKACFEPCEECVAFLKTVPVALPELLPEVLQQCSVGQHGAGVLWPQQRFCLLFSRRSTRQASQGAWGSELCV